MGFAFTQQSLEHLVNKNYRLLFALRILLSLFLIAGLYTLWVLILLLLLALILLHLFQGPYNGGADRMSLLILSVLSLIQLTPSPRWQEVFFGYLAMQLLLSYFIAGWVKLINPDWRKGQALSNIFRFSVYPVSEQLRQLSVRPRLLFYTSWMVILFECLFPLSLISNISLIIALTAATLFHFSNACFFGLNRFFWIWIASYPSLLWFQTRLLS
ncbi:hypothetical protein MNBD_GAMMA12-728 [hydrothermal vent metagenome]|uniref:HTTM-like domain-containing protein n=1 Tax=hydrothermal vent metagenome TaxID=652676 RepID=A0A3B0Z2H7_9ZZZZ